MSEKATFNDCREVGNRQRGEGGGSRERRQGEWLELGFPPPPDTKAAVTTLRFTEVSTLRKRC